MSNVEGPIGAANVIQGYSRLSCLGFVHRVASGARSQGFRQSVLLVLRVGVIDRGCGGSGRRRVGGGCGPSVRLCRRLRIPFRGVHGRIHGRGWRRRSGFGRRGCRVR